ncbi:hypothetical protein [Nostoc sp.]|uniref:hypothetical protein n=1 Tax=Nostoc sp. TaxID=1180 RepID=UPI002FF990A2
MGEIISHVQEQERQKKIAQARNEITKQLNANSEDLKLQIDKQLSTFEKGFLGDVEQKIAAFKESKAKEIISSNTWLKQLAEIDQEFKSILNSIYTL